MQIINMSKTKLNSLEPLILPKNVTSTECELFKYPYYGKEKLLKKLHRTDGIIFANKLYTIEALNANKDSMPSNFVLPESLVSINKKIEAFTMKYIKGINLSVILNNPDITYEEKIHYLKSIGRILEQMQNIRKYTNLNRCSDITIADFWGIEKSLPEFDDNKGVSLVLVNSDKGREMFGNIKKDINYKVSGTKECLQPQLQYPSRVASTRDEFWEDYKNKGFKFVAKKYGRYNVKNRLKFRIKGLLK